LEKVNKNFSPLLYSSLFLKKRGGEVIEEKSTLKETQKNGGRGGEGLE